MTTKPNNKMRAKEFYQDQINNGITEAGFTKLTSTGISSDYENVFEFAEEYAQSLLKEKLRKQVSDEEIDAKINELYKELKDYSPAHCDGVAMGVRICAKWMKDRLSQPAEGEEKAETDIHTWENAMELAGEILSTNDNDKLTKCADKILYFAEVHALPNQKKKKTVMRPFQDPNLPL